MISRNTITGLILGVLVVGTIAVIIAFRYRSASRIVSSANPVAQSLTEQTTNTPDLKLESLPIMSQATILTNKGNVTIELFLKDAPKTTANFINLAGKGFYDEVIFHRVIKGFMIQGGDPTGTGRGGPGYTFADELNSNTESYKLGYVRGVVAMANAGPDTNGSQFFIMHADYPLPHNYTIFGRVISGLETVDIIATTPTDENDRPRTPVIIQKIILDQ